MASDLIVQVWHQKMLSLTSEDAVIWLSSRLTSSKKNIRFDIWSALIGCPDIPAATISSHDGLRRCRMWSHYFIFWFVNPSIAYGFSVVNFRRPFGHFACIWKSTNRQDFPVVHQLIKHIPWLHFLADLCVKEVYAHYALCVHKRVMIFRFCVAHVDIVRVAALCMN